MNNLSAAFIQFATDERDENEQKSFEEQQALLERYITTVSRFMAAFLPEIFLHRQCQESPPRVSHDARR